ncbi:hypothetical protein [Paraliomyxa miuraensis]|uniref:hypothetical protein n=1 Tax=Paraliomyxa miuraensis TaxID=376150 RepID=UPI00224E80F7|nr:hypothetical protein [Paraliomyxa miuraensis]MCX4239431.1 hypothetical protein [Paraliomyxa miuraensis]
MSDTVWRVDFDAVKIDRDRRAGAVPRRSDRDPAAGSAGGEAAEVVAPRVAVEANAAVDIEDACTNDPAAVGDRGKLLVAKGRSLEALNLARVVVDDKPVIDGTDPASTIVATGQRVSGSSTTKGSEAATATGAPSSAGRSVASSGSTTREGWSVLAGLVTAPCGSVAMGSGCAMPTRHAASSAIVSPMRPLADDRRMSADHESSTATMALLDHPDVVWVRGIGFEMVRR